MCRPQQQQVGDYTGSEQLAMVSTKFLLHALLHIWMTNQTSGILADFRHRYTRTIPLNIHFKGLPSLTMIHCYVHQCCTPLYYHRSSAQAQITYSQHVVEVVRETQRRRKRFAQEHPLPMNMNVPDWILYLTHHSLSLDPPPPTSVIADCLSIVAIDLDCDISNIVTSDERYV